MRLDLDNATMEIEQQANTKKWHRCLVPIDKFVLTWIIFRSDVFSLLNTFVSNKAISAK